MGEDEAEEGGDDEKSLHFRRKNKNQAKMFGTRERDEKRYSLQAAQWQLWFKPGNYKTVDYLSTISDTCKHTCFRDASTWFSVLQCVSHLLWARTEITWEGDIQWDQFSYCGIPTISWRWVPMIRACLTSLYLWKFVAAHLMFLYFRLLIRRSMCHGHCSISD